MVRVPIYLQYWTITYTIFCYFDELIQGLGCLIVWVLWLTYKAYYKGEKILFYQFVIWMLLMSANDLLGCVTGLCYI